MKFGDYLRKCRDKMEWTQPEAAAKIEIEQSYLSKLETGKSHPSEEIFSKLLEVYNIDVNELYESISSEELAKLKELKQVRILMLDRHNEKVTTTRGWLITGFVMLLMGGCFLGFAIIPDHAATEHTYRSQGELHEDEPLDLFKLVERKIEATPDNQDLIAKQRELLTRIDQMDKTFGYDKGDSYVKSTLAGRRYYEKIGVQEMEKGSAYRWFLAPSFMLIFGAIGCFYISRRWS